MTRRMRSSISSIGRTDPGAGATGRIRDMAKKSPPDPAKMSFEAAIAELESIVACIEEGDIALEEALAARKRGEALVARCRTVLDQAEQEIRTLDAANDDAENADED